MSWKFHSGAWLVAAGLAVAGTGAASATLAAEAPVPRFGTHDIVLHAGTSYNGGGGTPNPFTDVSLTATVTAPSGEVHAVEGFFDGNGAGGMTGKIFKVRVYADIPGTWTYLTSSNVSSLDGRSGSFRCAGTLRGVFGRGPVVQGAEDGRYYAYQDGTPVFLTGKFLDSAAPVPLKYSHTLLSERLSAANRQALLKRHLAMKLNKINVYLANQNDYRGFPTTPWVGTATQNDKRRFDLQRWRMFEQQVAKLRGAGLLAQLWLFADDSNFGALADEDRRLLVRYAMARLSGYVNTMVTLVLEWQEGWSVAEVHDTASYLDSKNPWQRLVSVHGAEGDFAFPDAPWADYLDVQAGNGRTHAAVHASTLRNRALANKPLIQEEHGLGAENTANRQNAWAAFLGGAAGVGTGAYLEHLVSFSATVPFSRMAPAQGLVASGSAYAMAEPNRTYVFYLPAGGRLRADLRALSGLLSVEWYNPRTGARSGVAGISGGLIDEFVAPSNEDWVLTIRG